MNKTELDDFLEANKNIEWQKEEGAMLFRNTNLPWYMEEQHRATRITDKKLEELDAQGLMHNINKGVDVDCITRITGYFSKTKNWNPGKTEELKDRYKPALEGEKCAELPVTNFTSILTDLEGNNP